MNRMLKEKRKRKWWTHPINSSRLLQGAFYTLYSNLKADEEKFFIYFRMSPTIFDSKRTECTPLLQMNYNCRSGTNRSSEGLHTLQKYSKPPGAARISSACNCKSLPRGNEAVFGLFDHSTFLLVAATARKEISTLPHFGCRQHTHTHTLHNQARKI